MIRINSFISWVGGKKALRSMIYGLLPKKYDRYIEVFGGAGWVLFGMPPDLSVPMEVYNDYNSNLANLYHCVKNRTWEFIRQLGFLPLNSRDEFAAIYKFINMEEYDSSYLQQELELAKHYLEPPDFEEIKEIMTRNAEPSDVRRAAAFYKLIRYSYGSGCTSYGCQPHDVRSTFAAIWAASHRLAGTVIENKDFEGLIRQYDRENAFFYCDPPYYETESHYAVKFEKTDHVRLRDTLAAIQGKWMVSYNDSDYIRDLYQDFYILGTTRLNNLAQRYARGCEFPEVIITNYDPNERQGEGKQISLFDYPEIEKAYFLPRPSEINQANEGEFRE